MAAAFNKLTNGFHGIKSTLQPIVKQTIVGLYAIIYCKINIVHQVNKKPPRFMGGF